MKLTLGFSPCPNDTFIFDALVSGTISTGKYVFDVVLEDVQTLNKWALEGKLDITKLSFPALFRSSNEYQLLNSGAALGRGVGPLLVSAKPLPELPQNFNELSVALPGEHTTAHLLFNFAFPDAKKKTHMLFSAIEKMVLSGEHDLGVLIHENRFTYAERGLHLVADLGTVWEQRMQVPIPLGAIAIRKGLGDDVANDINRLISESLAYAWKKYPDLSPFITGHAQEMSEEVMRKHINLYVNEFTTDLGTTGHAAVETLQREFNSL
ncbi:MAG: 1,4-dihydroxy-6-naphthoate synthase [Chitinophagaceae bacterium]|nr:1,4-dihydroxy-6-naphthoate synthase [Chitinophagaceae bacterium]